MGVCTIFLLYDFKAFGISDISSTYMYLMNKHDIKTVYWLLTGIISATNHTKYVSLSYQKSMT